MQREPGKLERLLTSRNIVVDGSLAIKELQQRHRRRLHEAAETGEEPPIAVYNDARTVLTDIRSQIRKGASPFDFSLQALSASSLLDRVPEERKEEVADTVVAELAMDIADTILVYLQDFQGSADELVSEQGNALLDSHHLEDQARRELGLPVSKFAKE